MRLENKTLSQKEIEYLHSPEKFDLDHSYVLKHKIKSKVKALNEELKLLTNAGFLNLTENSNSLMEFNKTVISSNQACFQEFKVRSPGFEPGSSAWEAYTTLPITVAF